MEKEILKSAYNALNRRNRILAPSSEATISYPDFDPCRAVQVFAIVSWPATINCNPITLKHVINNDLYIENDFMDAIENGTA